MNAIEANPSIRPPLRRVIALSALIGLLIVGTSMLVLGESASPVSLRAAIDAEHPGVPWIDTATLASWLAPDSGRHVVLLDVRTAAEFNVSQIRGARRVDPDAHDMAALGLARGATIVVYCSVGARSAALGERLRAAGYRHVYNLEGGIFQWANEGRPVYRGTSRVTQVHPYDRTWGRFLREQYRAPL